MSAAARYLVERDQAEEAGDKVRSRYLTHCLALVERPPEEWELNRAVRFKHRGRPKLVSQSVPMLVNHDTFKALNSWLKELYSADRIRS